MLKTEATAGIFEEVNTQTPIVGRNALKHNPSPMIGASRHAPMVDLGGPSGS